MTTAIGYIEGAGFTVGSAEFQHSLALSFMSRSMDKYGRETGASENSSLSIRSYYHVPGDALGGGEGVGACLEDLMRLMSTRRAVVLETEIMPMAGIIDARNKLIDSLGTLLAAVSKTMTKQEADEDTEHDYPCQGLAYYLKQYFTGPELDKANILSWVDTHCSSPTNQCMSAKEDGVIATANQLIKAKLDVLNNESQTDMARMENLVTKRDEAYTLSSDLALKISDGRTMIMNNIS